ncbi:MAG: hypothetical protein JNJ73_00200 [Hyphomonadaceae bacterium]|nr:hypothetical protein [Hyphomonadaceae bacterium]
MMFGRTLLAAAAIAMSLGLSAMGGSAHAQSFQNWMQPQDAGRGQSQRARILSVREVAEIVRSQRGGQLLDVLVLEDGGARPFYVLRWRGADGVVEDIRVDAQSGRVMGRVG